jgi:hypothetical protein
MFNLFRSSPVFFFQNHRIVHPLARSPKGQTDSGSKWRFDPHCRLFTADQYARTLSLLETGTLPPPASQVYAHLPFGMKHFQGNPKRDAKFLKTFKIEKTMKNLSFNPRSDVSLCDKIIETNQQMVEKVARGVVESNKKYRDESVITDLNKTFLDLCGFTEFPFKRVEIVGKDLRTFKLFDNQFNCLPDHLIEYYDPDGDGEADVVLVAEDKTMEYNGKKDQKIPKQGHRGQIMCESLQAFSLNYRKNPPVFRDIFIVRVINFHVAFFRIVPIKTTVNTLVNTKYVPARKLKLLCNIKNPDKNPGLSLIDPEQRKEAVQMMADIRNSILKGKLK